MSSSMSAADRYREDSLWPKYREMKAVLGCVAPCAGAPASALRFDDSGRLVDMTEVQHGLFIGSE